MQTVELLAALIRSGHAGIIHFETFPAPSGLDPGDEARVNIRLTDRLWVIALRLADDPVLARAKARQDAAAAMALIAGPLFGA